MKSKYYSGRIPRKEITAPRMRDFVEKFFKAYDRKADVTTTDHFDYISINVELSRGTYEIGFNHDNNTFFALIERVIHGDRETPDDVDYEEVIENVDIVDACVAVALKNEKERYESATDAISYMAQDAYDDMDELYS